jgi:carbon storage regulator
MLVRSRRVGERIVIDEKVTVTVIGRRGRQVCLGIDAPQSVLIRRQELRPREAAGTDPRKHADRGARHSS